MEKDVLGAFLGGHDFRQNDTLKNGTEKNAVPSVMIIALLCHSTKRNFAEYHSAAPFC